MRKKKTGKSNPNKDFVRRLKVEIGHLKKVSHSKDEFIRITNHELRTPLDVIRGNIDMVLKGEAGTIPNQAKEYLNDVLLGADRLTKLVNAMLDLSRVESGRMNFSLEDINTRSFLKNIYEEFAPIAKGRGVTIILETKSDLPNITSDKTKLYEILDNLLGNAIKFTPKGGIITINGGKSPDGSDVARIFVQDTGIGIRAEDLKKLFKEFPSIESTSVGAEKGNGLGLALIYKITARLSGRMWAESAGLGKGSTFFFELPVTNSKAAKKLLSTYPKNKRG